MNKNLRNRLIALGCLIVFFALGVLYYVNWVVQKPFAIILFLCDDLTASVLTPARNYEGGADHRLHIEKFPHLALLTTYANDFAVPDAASAASSMATGHKVNNRFIGVDAGGTPLPTLLEIANDRGRATGIVSNVSLTGPTVAAFYAKTSDPTDYDAIARQLVENADINVLLGGGAGDFIPDFKEGRRKDGRDLILEMRNKGYDIVRNKSELESTPIWRAPKILGLFSMGDLGFADEISAFASQPTLAEMVQRAIQLLQYNPKGYLLVVDASLAGKAAALNAGERTLREILALDQAVASAVAYAGQNALIVVAGKQNIGGLRLNGYPFRNDRGAGILGMNAQGIPSLTWSTGPGSGAAASSASLTEPPSVQLPTAIGVAEDTIAVSTGPGSETLTGFKDNTDLFNLIDTNL